MNATVNENCIGCGLCAGTCPEVFHMGDDGLAHGSGIPEGQLEAAQEAEPEESARLRALRDRLYAAIAATDGIQPTVEVDAGSRDFLPNIVHGLADEWESETMVLRFDQLGICVAGGSACSSHSLEPSHVLRAMGITGDTSYNALRISMGRYTTEADIAAFEKALKKVLNW